MDSLPSTQRAYYAYLTRIYAMAYAVNNRVVLGMSIRGWVTLIGLGLLVFGWLRDWPLWLLALITLVLIWLLLSFQLARRANYKRFIPDQTELMAIDEPSMIEPNKRVPAQATGSFSVSGYGDNVLHRPAQYWRVPLGDHIVMVEPRPGKFLYQFFGASTLQSISSGWLLSAAEPREALAITFLSKWGPEYTKFQAYDDGLESSTAPKAITIYLTFDDTADHNAVWQTIVGDARSIRA